MQLFKFILFSAFFCLMTSCAKDDNLDLLAERTVMVYMAANNSLAAEAYKNINQMEESFTNINGKLIVYARIFGQAPKLYEITHDRSPEIRSKVLKTYNDHDSSDPEIMKMVFADIKQLSPARSYGAVLWSHATNWAPANLGRVGVRSFGDDNFSRMDVQDLKQALPSGLDFLVFDACSMASVEVIYELRNVAPYILASPTEVLSVGMPYDRINALFFSDDVKAGLSEIARSYVAYYQEKSGLEQSASFALIDTRHMPQLAAATKKILSSNAEQIRTINRNSIQRLDLDPSTPVVAFDFLDIFEQNFERTDLQELRTALTNVVVYKAHTDSFLGKPVIKFSGLSSYIPIPEEQHLADFYKSLSWSVDAGYGSLFWW